MARSTSLQTDTAHLIEEKGDNASLGLRRPPRSTAAGVSSNSSMRDVKLSRERVLREQEGGGETETKIGVDMKGTRHNPNSTDQSARRVMHAGNMAVCFLVPRPCFTKVQ
ncbi:hypothetical protein CgunFtcFv8_009678 [Champsocephalus gunnari]|uniref:Uncharacterized protein n=1 Tax=Champsocephalus gunnari TaxID=52237 RepID=A0AAN8H1M5_CHAGU|nr:hypothetical protein CgunFtcFv8_009678 [Champsocephalus gunnari]